MKKNVGCEVGIVMGSDSDWALVKKASELLESFGVVHEVRVISAHRSPAIASAYAANADKRGLRVLIAAAGGAAHLGGVLAAHTTLPVIGIPVEGGALHGMDALLSTVQMPAGIPVATVAVGSSGPTNAALLAVQIIALGNPTLRSKLRDYKRNLEKKVIAADKRVQEETQRRLNMGA